MGLTSAPGAASHGSQQCLTSAVIEITVFRRSEEGVVAPAQDVKVQVKVTVGEHETKSASTTDASGIVHFIMTDMEQEAEMHVAAEEQYGCVVVSGGTTVTKTLYIGGPYLVWSFQNLRQRPEAVYLREQNSQHHLMLELLGEPGDWQVVLPSIGSLTVIDKQGNSVQTIERLEESVLFDDITHHDGRANAIQLPLSLNSTEGQRVLAHIADEKGNMKLDSSVIASVQTPTLKIEQRRARSTADGQSFDKTAKQVVYSADCPVKCAIEGVSSAHVLCNWTISETAISGTEANITHHFQVPDDREHARQCATVVVEVKLAASPAAKVRLEKKLILALPTYHGDLPDITDDYLLNEFAWNANSPVRFDRIADAVDLARIWQEEAGLAPSEKYLLRACPDLKALAGIPFDPKSRGSARRLLGGVVSTGLKEKGLTVNELRAIVGHETIHLQQHAQARDNPDSIWRALDDAGVDAFCLREVEAHVWEMAQNTLSHKMLQATVDYFYDYFCQALDLYGGLKNGDLKDQVAVFINQQYEAIPGYCHDLKGEAQEGGAFEQRVNRV